MTREEKMELTRKIGLFGLSDLRKIAPIGDLGYVNGWYPPFWGDTDMWLDVELPIAIMKAFREQRDKFGFKVEGYSSGYRQTDHHSYCKELGLRWSVDSSD